MPSRSRSPINRPRFPPPVPVALYGLFLMARRVDWSQNYEVDIQQLQIQLRHEPRAKQEQIEQDAMAAFRAREKRLADLERNSRSSPFLNPLPAL